MIELSVENLHLTYGDNPVLKGVSMTLGRGEVVSLLGPSGSGKTTLLRAVAGLEKPTSGRIAIGNRTVYDGTPRSEIPAEERNLGLVFQSYALWPHKTVFDNVAYPLKIQKVPMEERKERTNKALSLVHLEEYAARFPNQLSGGQQQRVALARALVAAPGLLLLDEPLSNLDAKLRESMRFEIKELQKKLGLTVIYVTHDQAEAMAMSDRIIVMYKGVIQQVDVPTKIYEHPANSTVADFIGLVNFLDGEVKDGAVQLSQIGCSLPLAVNFNGPALVAVRPEHIAISKTSGALRGKIVSKLYLGDSTDCRVAVGDTVMRVIDRGSSFENYADGEEVFLSFGHIMAFPK